MAVAAVGLFVLVAIGCGGESNAGRSSASRASIAAGGHPSSAAIARRRRARQAELRVPREAEIVRGDQGWARTGDGVYWTADGGRRWRRITPPTRSPLDIQDVYFRDQRRGWALA
jgi:hypothetical protein